MNRDRDVYTGHVHASQKPTLNDLIQANREHIDTLLESNPVIIVCGEVREIIAKDDQQKSYLMNKLEKRGSAIPVPYIQL